VIALNAVRGGVSNIRWAYGHETIPRHLRDIVVSEYGVADLRGKSDEQVIAAMLAIADSRFQPELLRAAKDAGKIARGFEIPAAHRDNTPARIARALAPMRDLLPPFPFGTDFTAVEQRLIPALGILQGAHPAKLARMAVKGLFAREDAETREGLVRMGLEKPVTIQDRIYKALVLSALTKSSR
jgi:hypothetical protein